jgi:phosphatidylinositol alpha-1,6-mannosyltransferase
MRRADGLTLSSVLALVTDAFGGRGGIAQYNRDFLGAIAPTTALRILPRHAPDPVSDLPAGATQLLPQPGRWRYALAAVLDALRQRPDAVFCGHLYMAPLAAIIARLCRARLVVQTHGIEAWPRPSRAVRWATERAELVLAVSRYTRAQVLSWAALDPDRVAVLPNTVSARFTPGDRAAARRRFDLGDQRVLLTVGRLAISERYKGQDRVIEALPALIAASHDVLYLIAGDGDDRPRLEALARSAGVSDRVRFLGAVGGDDLPDLYRAADLFVMPSTGEGFGIAYLEAMACGTPALGLAAGGAPDPLGNGKLGWLLSSIADLSSMLQAELTSPLPPTGRLTIDVDARFGLSVFRNRSAAILTNALHSDRINGANK